MRFSLMLFLLVNCIIFGCYACHSATAPKREEGHMSLCSAEPEQCRQPGSVKILRSKVQGEFGKVFLPDIDVRMDTAKQVLSWLVGSGTTFAFTANLDGLAPLYPGHQIACAQIFSKQVVQQFGLSGNVHALDSDMKVVMEPLGTYPELDAEIDGALKTYITADCAVFSVIRK